MFLSNRLTKISDIMNQAGNNACINSRAIDMVFDV